MDKDTLRRLEQVEAENNALRQLLFSHILAVSIVDADLAGTTLEIADTQIEGAVALGKGRAAVVLSSMLDHLREAIGPDHANDA